MEGHKRARTELSVKINNYQHPPQAQLKEISSADIDAWCKLLKEKMLSDRSFAKEYLKLLVSEIVLTGNELQIKGDSRALVSAVKYTAEKKSNNLGGGY